MSDDAGNATDLEQPKRRDFLFIATGAMGAVGAGFLAVPFVKTLGPSAQTRAAGVTDIDLGPITSGQIVRVMHRGRPIFVRYRTEKEIAEARAVPLTDLLDPQRDQDRVKPGQEKWLIISGSCTHLGCVPIDNRGDFGGWFCPCHGSQFDVSGRVRRGPAPTNLPVPKYEFVSDTKVRVT
jgi:ubiquinol-cytochrome c reductase iron-sulfur subunit